MPYLEIIKDGNMTLWIKQTFDLAGRGLVVSIFMSICQMTMIIISIINIGRDVAKSLTSGGGGDVLIF